MKAHYHVISGDLVSPEMGAAQAKRTAKAVKDPHIVACNGKPSGQFCSRVVDGTIEICPGVYDWHKPVHDWSKAPKRALAVMRENGI